MTQADLAFLRGRVVTLDAASTVVSALAVREGLIVAVGSDADIGGLIGPATRVVDLAGGTLLPGINDSHYHGVSAGLAKPPLMLDLTAGRVESIAEIVALVAEAVAAARPGEWIVGAGWDVGFLAECRAEPARQPGAVDLDPVSPDNPVFLQDFSYHTAWVNSAAMALAGIGVDTVAPAGSTIARDEAGRPSGLLSEGAQHDVMELLPPATDAMREVAVRTSLRELAALGITSITEPGLGPGDATGGMNGGGLDVYRRLEAAGELTVRTSVLLFPVPMSKGFGDFRHALDGMSTELDADPRMLRILGVKMLADGIPPNRTAWMYDEYTDGGRGALTIPGETDEIRVGELGRMVAYAHRQGYQVGVHVTGDRGIDAVVDAFVAAVREHPRADPRHYLIHGDFVTPRSIALCALHGFGINMNPTIKWTIADLEVGVVGQERADYEWPYRDAIAAGVPVASGSDAPVTAPDWRRGVASMVLRTAKGSGRVSGPEQRIGVDAALRTYTVNGARQDFAEDWKGSLEVGKVADLCVLREDLLAIPPEEIPDVTVLMTVLGGRVVFERDSVCDSAD